MKYLGVFIVVIFLGCMGCHTKSKEKSPCPKDCGTQGGKPCPKDCIPTNAPVAGTAKVGNILFYLETSGSMGGYLNGGTEFKNVITDMVATLKGAEKSGAFSIHTIAETAQPYPGDSDKFIKDIALVQIANKKSSEMHKMFGMLLSKWQEDDVIVFISDCILSFSDKDIKARPMINVQDAESTLKSYIKSTFQQYHQKNVATTVYGFHSQFNGTYYDYKNTKIPLSGKSRPYYIWLIGKKQNIQQVAARLESQPAFAPGKRIDFGFTKDPISDYMILPSLTTGRKFASKSPYKSIEFSDLSKPQEIWIGIKADGLGKDIDPAFLKNNIQQLIEKDNLSAQVIGAKTKDQILSDPSIRMNTFERQAFLAYSHAIKISFKSMSQAKGSLVLALPFKMDTWYTEWSTMDDSKIKAETSPKTFAFEHLMNGVKEAYQLNSNPYLLKLSIPVSKD